MRQLIFIPLSLLMATFLSVGSINAATISVDFQGFSQGSSTVNQKLDGISRNARAGMFDLAVVGGNSAMLNLDSMQNIEAFCVELDQYLTTNSTVQYTLVSALDFFGNQQKIRQISQLYSGFFQTLEEQVGSANQRIYSSAFQVALWDIVYDHDASTLLEEGRYTPDNAQVNPVALLAQSWLSQLGSQNSRFDFWVMQSDTSQDLLVASPRFAKAVSEPAVFGLFLMSIAVIIRRSKLLR